MRKIIGFLCVIAGICVVPASAQQFGVTAPVPGMIVGAGPTPTPQPVPVPPSPPMTIRGSVQTLHGAALPSDINDGGKGLQTSNRAMLVAIMPVVTRGTWLNLLEVNEYGYPENAASTLCTQYEPPPPTVGPPAPQILQGCADRLSGAFVFFANWEGKPLNPFRQHYLQVSTPTFIGRMIKLPIGVSDVNLKTINLEASPIEMATVSGELITGNRFRFTVDLKKIVPEALDLNVYAVVWVPVEPYFPYTVSLPTVKTDKFTTLVPFDVAIPDGLLPGTGPSATIVIADANQAFTVYAQAYAYATK